MGQQSDNNGRKSEGKAWVEWGKSGVESEVFRRPFGELSEFLP